MRCSVLSAEKYCSTVVREGWLRTLVTAIAVPAQRRRAALRDGPKDTSMRRGHPGAVRLHEAIAMLSVAALRELRALLDSQPVVVTMTTAIDPEGSQQAGGDDARPDRASTGTMDADVRATRTMADTPGTRSLAVPGSGGSTAASGAAGRGTHKERG